jgi:hypothetical protein
VLYRLSESDVTALAAAIRVSAVKSSSFANVRSATMSIVGKITKLPPKLWYATIVEFRRPVY